MTPRPKKKFRHAGKILHVSDILRMTGVSKDTYVKRLQRGWAPLDALTVPARADCPHVPYPDLKLYIEECEF